jgi:hypothetical protein
MAPSCLKCETLAYLDSIKAPMASKILTIGTRIGSRAAAAHARTPLSGPAAAKDRKGSNFRVRSLFPERSVLAQLSRSAYVRNLAHTDRS